MTLELQIKQIGWIYKIVCKDEKVKEVYYGSTGNFKERGYMHKSICCNINSPLYNSKVYTCIRANGGFDNWSMEKIQEVHFNERSELNILEDTYINLDNPYCLNTVGAYHDNAKYYKDNADKIKKYNAKYRKDNAEKIKKNKVEYREAHRKKIDCPCGAHYVGNSPYKIDRHHRSIKHQTYLQGILG